MTNQEILDSAPDGATHYGVYECGEIYWYKCGDHGYYAIHKGRWNRRSGIGSDFIYSLSNIKRIVELENALLKCAASKTRAEASKIASEALDKGGS